MELTEYLSYLKETIDDPFFIGKSDLINYILFKEGRRTIDENGEKILISVYHKVDKELGGDHVKRRFEERKSTGNIGSHMKSNPFPWPKAYLEYLNDAIDKIYSFNSLENGAYNIFIRRIDLQYLMIIGKGTTRRKDSIPKYILMNTVEPGGSVVDDYDDLADYVEFRRKRHPAKKLFVEEIQNDNEVQITKII